MIFALMVCINDIDEIQPGRDFAIQFLIMMLHLLVLTIPIFLYCFHLFHLCSHRLTPSQSPSRYVWASIIGSLVIAIVCSSLSRWTRIYILNDLGIHEVVGITSINDVLIASAAVMISLFLLTLTRRQQVVVENGNLLSEHLLTRYEALEKQVDPHFLFNSLNTLGGLIGVDDNKASHYLQQLASTYRYVMMQHESHTVTLAEELEFVDAYCDLIQTRYGENLVFTRRIDSGMLGHRLPPISIQLLIENAIKHNVVSARHPLTIVMETTADGYFRVSNPIQLKQDAQERVESGHVGLKNLDQRYQMLFHRSIKVTRTEQEFIVDLPLEE